MSDIAELGTRPLEAAALLAAAERETGLSDWGADPTFRVGLDKLLAAVESAEWTHPMRGAVAAQAVSLLSTRLRLEEDARQHPQILLGRIDRPVIVTDLPRSGTT